MADYVCPICSLTFQKNYLLLYHLRHHFGQYPYICLICSTGFEQLSNLILHQTKSHSSNLLCRRCGQSFQDLCDHECIELRPFVCEGCGTGFSRLCTLVSHSKSCKDYSFYSPTLREYQYCYKGGYNCHTCRLEFTALSQLINHRMKEHISSSSSFLNSSKVSSTFETSVKKRFSRRPILCLSRIVQFPRISDRHSEQNSGKHCSQGDSDSGANYNGITDSFTQTTEQERDQASADDISYNRNLKKHLYWKHRDILNTRSTYHYSLKLSLKRYSLRQSLKKYPHQSKGAADIEQLLSVGSQGIQGGFCSHCGIKFCNLRRHLHLKHIVKLTPGVVYQRSLNVRQDSRESDMQSSRQVALITTISGNLKMNHRQDIVAGDAFTLATGASALATGASALATGASALATGYWQ